MKLITLALAAAGSVALFANGNTSSATADVDVKIVVPILVSNVFGDPLNFGAVTVRDIAQPIDITYVPDVNGYGTPSFSNCDPFPLNGQLGPSTFAWFHIRKDHNIAWSGVNIAVDPVVSLGSGVQVATANSPRALCTALPLLPGMDGNDANHFYVGGTLTAPAGTFGTFHGVMNCTVNYQ